MREGASKQIRQGTTIFHYLVPQATNHRNEVATDVAAHQARLAELEAQAAFRALLQMGNEAHRMEAAGIREVEGLHAKPAAIDEATGAYKPSLEHSSKLELQLEKGQRSKGDSRRVETSWH